VWEGTLVAVAGAASSVVVPGRSILSETICFSGVAGEDRGGVCERAIGRNPLPVSSRIGVPPKSARRLDLWRIAVERS
jgi:hypothetical protein